MDVQDNSSHPKGFQDVNTNGADYTYDDNGNMTSDLTNILIKFNTTI